MLTCPNHSSNSMSNRMFTLNLQKEPYNVRLGRTRAIATLPARHPVRSYVNIELIDKEIFAVFKEFQSQHDYTKLANKYY